MPAAQVKHLQETMSTDAATIQRLQTQLGDAQAIIDSFEEQAANQVGEVFCSQKVLSSLVVQGNTVILLYSFALRSDWMTRFRTGIIHGMMILTKWMASAGGICGRPARHVRGAAEHAVHNDRASYRVGQPGAPCDMLTCLVQQAAQP
jgi:hypothetical protein